MTPSPADVLELRPTERERDDHERATATNGVISIKKHRGSWTGESLAALRAGSTISLVDANRTPVCHGTK